MDSAKSASVRPIRGQPVSLRSSALWFFEGLKKQTTRQSILHLKLPTALDL
jgi:hypothetical protein